LLTIRDSQMKQMADASPGTKMVQPCDKSWIEFRLVDRDNQAVPGEKYTVRLPDQSLMTGSLDREGKVRFEGIAAGRASICFPGMDRKEWRPLSGS
jgi:type VI secretion system secreted protein VgrG